MRLTDALVRFFVAPNEPEAATADGREKEDVQQRVAAYARVTSVEAPSLQGPVFSGHDPERSEAAADAGAPLTLASLADRQRTPEAGESSEASLLTAGADTASAEVSHVEARAPGNDDREALETEVNAAELPAPSSYYGDREQAFEAGTTSVAETVDEDAPPPIADKTEYTPWDQWKPHETPQSDVRREITDITAPLYTGESSYAEATSADFLTPTAAEAEMAAGEVSDVEVRAPDSDYREALGAAADAVETPVLQPNPGDREQPFETGAESVAETADASAPPPISHETESQPQVSSAEEPPTFDWWKPLETPAAEAQPELTDVTAPVASGQDEGSSEVAAQASAPPAFHPYSGDGEEGAGPGETLEAETEADDDRLPATTDAEAALAEIPSSSVALPVGRDLERLEAAASLVEALGLGFHLGSAVERIAAAAGQGSAGVPPLREAAWLIERYIAILEQRPIGADIHASAARLARAGDAIVGLKAIAAALEAGSEDEETDTFAASSATPDDPNGPAAGTR